MSRVAGPEVELIGVTMSPASACEKYRAAGSCCLIQSYACRRTPRIGEGLAASVYAGNIQRVPAFPEELADCTGFEWDAGNAEKNWELHEVSRGEAEETFFNRPLVVAPDAGHSRRETRFAALGRTEEGRRLTVVLTLRGTLIRVISAHDMSRRERRIYEQASTKG